MSSSGLLYELTITLIRIPVDRIPVYVLNALYLAPITFWTYLKYGRPPKRGGDGESERSHCHQSRDTDSKEESHDGHGVHGMDMESGRLDHGAPESNHAHEHQDHHESSGHNHTQQEGGGHDMSGHAMHHGSDDRPMFATITVAVCHCGAGCLLGDVVGEWLVYGTGAQINGRDLWPEYLIGKCLPPYPCVVDLTSSGLLEAKRW